MTGYAIKLPKELKESLASDFDSNWDSDRDDGEAPHQHAAENAPARASRGSVSSESSEGKESDDNAFEEKDRPKSIGSRLKRILSTDTKLLKLSESEEEER
ncbi:uncharacterized protein BKCO1_7800033 [Diplodia corticola]|uniref:Uncharacterized protein n=1 Tax=Diplodia corticola TaxID=236234 RepID=A0A1J9RAT8_9PEZI|nr:uncharacterized protein BKCO1_7800033 [Diplodia corticola]OJD29539.1 hypothetical protein BKCO1_7800033 [Diplodia corticola]